MADITQLFAASGSLPMKFEFEADQDIVQLLYIAGSCYSANGNEMIGAQVLVDGDVIGNVTVFANEANSHKATVAQIIPMYLTMGMHVLELVALPGSSTVSDENDVWSGSTLEFSSNKPFIRTISGPVPSFTPYDSNILGPALLFLSASCYLGDAGSGGITAILDDNTIASSALYFNEANSHKALPPLIVPFQLTPGKHQLGFGLLTGNELTDENDVFTMAILV